MREKDIPPRGTLRDILYKKIRDPNIMKFDLERRKRKLGPVSFDPHSRGIFP